MSFPADISRGGPWAKSGQAIVRMPDRQLRPCAEVTAISEQAYRTWGKSSWRKLARPCSGLQKSLCRCNGSNARLSRQTPLEMLSIPANKQCMISEIVYYLTGADAGFRVRGGAKGRGYERGWVREGATPPPAPGRGYGGAL